MAFPLSAEMKFASTTRARSPRSTYRSSTRELKYVVANAQLELTPVYTIDLATGAGESYSVTVDASTGQTHVMSAVVNVIGDGTSPIISPRDLRTPRTFADLAAS